MTELREQLRRSRDAYESAEYPGDLAAELLPSTRRRLWRFVPSLLGGVLAASISVAIGMQGGGTPESPSAVMPIQLAQSPRPVPVAYTFPDRMPLTLPASPLLPTMPPVTVSWAELNDLGQRQYDELAPKLRQHFTWPGLSPSKPADTDPGSTTQRAV